MTEKGKNSAVKRRVNEAFAFYYTKELNDDVFVDDLVTNGCKCVQSKSNFLGSSTHGVYLTRNLDCLLKHHGNGLQDIRCVVFKVVIRVVQGYDTVYFWNEFKIMVQSYRFYYNF